MLNTRLLYFHRCIIKKHDGDDFNKIYKVLSELKNKKTKIEIILIEKWKDVNESSNFEQDYCSRRACGI